jgi:hypothetical protein
MTERERELELEVAALKGKVEVLEKLLITLATKPVVPTYIPMYVPQPAYKPSPWTVNPPYVPPFIGPDVHWSECGAAANPTAAAVNPTYAPSLGMHAAACAAAPMMQGTVVLTSHTGWGSYSHHGPGLNAAS